MAFRFKSGLAVFDACLQQSLQAARYGVGGGVSQAVLTPTLERSQLFYSKACNRHI